MVRTRHNGGSDQEEYRGREMKARASKIVVGCALVKVIKHIDAQAAHQ